LPAPMVLGPKGPGRVGRRQANNHKDRYRVIDNGLFLYGGNLLCCPLISDSYNSTQALLMMGTSY
ncbi:hypothetical protein, partial [Paenibacillus sp. NPDC093718]|uniref:hypothetical protein n=1 Tax=Paenibacillus sp. NPDC093718 TaxID=3390601 RepID=UPI003CFF47C0